jgi:hypothetical protein
VAKEKRKKERKGILIKMSPPPPPPPPLFFLSFFLSGTNANVWKRREKRTYFFRVFWEWMVREIRRKAKLLFPVFQFLRRLRLTQSGRSEIH